MKHRLSVALAFSAGLIGAIVACQGITSAATFNQNRILDDSVYDNYHTMSAAQIDAFLNQFPSSCISTNSGFSAPDVTGYSPSPSQFFYGNAVSAGKVILHASQAYGLNPQVLLATLQKEEGLVDGSGPYGCGATALASAVGYGCTDSGTNTHNYSYPTSGSPGGLVTPLYYRNGTAVTSVTNSCVNSGPKAGFSEQIIHAAWLLKFGEQRSKGNINWAVVMTTTTDLDGASWSSNWDNSDDPQSCYSGPMTQGTWQVCPSGGSAPYDGYTTIDGVAVHMDDGATAALYWYTPHFSGNQNFFTIFTNWFVPYAWQPTQQSAYTDSTMSTPIDTRTLLPGQRLYVVIKALNNGSETWQKGVAGQQVNVGTSRAMDRRSKFCDASWLGTDCNRPTTTTETSVAPGETGTFGFWVTAPSQIGTYNEYFNLVADGTTWLNDPGLYWTFTVSYPAWQPTQQVAYSDDTMTTPVNTTQLGPSQKYYLVIKAKNTGTNTWQKGVARQQVNVGSSRPIDRRSAFCDASWLGTDCNRPGTSSETSIAPGQIGTFGFWITTPATPGVYNEYFNLVMDGTSWLNDPGLYWTLKVGSVAPAWQPTQQSAYTDNTMATPVDTLSLTPGQHFYVLIKAKNTGNVAWQKGVAGRQVNVGTAHPMDRSSNFCDASWLNTFCNRPTTSTEATVGIGQTGTFGFWVTAPSQTGTYNEYFNLVMDGTTWLNDPGLYWTMRVQ